MKSTGCDTPFWVLPKAAFEKVPVPCGRCPPCKLRRVNSWVFRLLQQDLISSSSHFVTLTYAAHSVPMSANGFMTLRKSDFQLYMKRLRKLCPTAKLKYYAAGEYGGKTKRPHFHAIVFGVDDKEKFYTAWKIDGVPIGIVDVGTVTGDSIAYTLKYIDKPGYMREFSRDDRVREFPLMSKGMGANYLTDEVKAFHKSDVSRMYITKSGGHKIAMPRYYQQKIFDEQEMRHFSRIAEERSEESEEKLRKQFERLYRNHPTSLDFETWKESCRLGRYGRFYSNQNPRDL